MIRYILRRLLIAVIQIFAVATIVFLVLRLMPGDPAVLALGTDRAPDPTLVTAMRHQLGLDKPLLVQYGTWIVDMVRFNFGKSIFYSDSASKLILDRLPNTLELALVSIVLAIIIGVLVGIIAAIRRGSFLDVALTSSTALGISIPVYVLGTLFVLIFALGLHWLPATGDTSLSSDFIGHIRTLILPALTLAFGLSASISRITRSSMLEVLNQEYIQTVRAKGLEEKSVIFKHALRNSLIPIVTVVGLQLGNLMGGTVLVENVFNWPGLSSMLVAAVNHRDYPMIQGCILVIAAVFIVINLVVDLTYGFLDPRVRSER